MRIQVIGSKPGAELLNKVDQRFYVNGGAKLSIEESMPVNLITGLNVLNYEGNVARDYVYNSFKKKRFNEVVFIAFQNEKVIESSFREKVNFEYKELMILSRSEKASIERSYTGGMFYFLLNLLLVPGPHFREKLSVLIWAIKRRELKLSTGLFAVLYILQTYKNSEVVISGIGFGLSEYWYGSENKRRAHFINDYAFLKSVLKSNEFWKRVSTTEDQLTDLFGIRQFTD
ncbi:MAG: hypothetical protein ACI9DJ_001311 [Algoriphagus sp.]|jgi:hypothetical protein